MDHNNLTREEKERLLQLLTEKRKRTKQRKLKQLYPDEDTMFEGQLFHSRHKYPKHMDFFKAGAVYRERCALAANRVGKTFGMGGYETACHLTGWYPDWWTGRRFERPVKAWAAGRNGETTRDILQLELLGKIKQTPAKKHVTGEGIILGESIIQDSITMKTGVADLIDTVEIKHASGGKSTLGFKSYKQGSGSFEGTAQDIIWLDEECPEDVYNECLIRTATTDGIIMLTFTPLKGLTPVVLNFLPHMAVSAD